MVLGVVVIEAETIVIAIKVFFMVVKFMEMVAKIFSW